VLGRKKRKKIGQDIAVHLEVANGASGQDRAEPQQSGGGCPKVIRAGHAGKKDKAGKGGTYLIKGAILDEKRDA